MQFVKLCQCMEVYSICCLTHHRTHDEEGISSVYGGARFAHQHVQLPGQRIAVSAYTRSQSNSVLMFALESVEATAGPLMPPAAADGLELGQPILEMLFAPNARNERPVRPIPGLNNVLRLVLLVRTTSNVHIVSLEATFAAPTAPPTLTATVDMTTVFASGIRPVTAAWVPKDPCTECFTFMCISDDLLLWHGRCRRRPHRHPHCSARILASLHKVLAVAHTHLLKPIFLASTDSAAVPSTAAHQDMGDAEYDAELDWAVRDCRGTVQYPDEIRSAPEVRWMRLCFLASSTGRDEVCIATRRSLLCLDLRRLHNLQAPPAIRLHPAALPVHSACDSDDTAHLPPVPPVDRQPIRDPIVLPASAILAHATLRPSRHSLYSTMHDSICAVTHLPHDNNHIVVATRLAVFVLHRFALSFQHAVVDFCSPFSPAKLTARNDFLRVLTAGSTSLSTVDTCHLSAQALCAPNAGDVTGWLLVGASRVSATVFTVVLGHPTDAPRHQPSCRVPKYELNWSIGQQQGEPDVDVPRDEAAPPDPVDEVLRSAGKWLSSVGTTVPAAAPATPTTVVGAGQGTLQVLGSVEVVDPFDTTTDVASGITVAACMTGPGPAATVSVFLTMTDGSTTRALATVSDSSGAYRAFYPPTRLAWTVPTPEGFTAVDYHLEQLFEYGSALLDASVGRIAPVPPQDPSNHAVVASSLTHRGMLWQDILGTLAMHQTCAHVPRKRLSNWLGGVGLGCDSYLLSWIADPATPGVLNERSAVRDESFGVRLAVEGWIRRSRTERNPCAIPEENDFALALQTLAMRRMAVVRGQDPTQSALDSLQRHELLAAYQGTQLDQADDAGASLPQLPSTLPLLLCQAAVLSNGLTDGGRVARLQQWLSLKWAADDLAWFRVDATDRRGRLKLKPRHDHRAPAADPMSMLTELHDDICQLTKTPTTALVLWRALRPKLRCPVSLQDLCIYLLTCHDIYCLSMFAAVKADVQRLTETVLPASARPVPHARRSVQQMHTAAKASNRGMGMLHGGFETYVERSRALTTARAQARAHAATSWGELGEAMMGKPGFKTQINPEAPTFAEQLMQSTFRPAPEEGDEPWSRPVVHTFHPTAAAPPPPEQQELTKPRRRCVCTTESRVPCDADDCILGDALVFCSDEAFSILHLPSSVRLAGIMGQLEAIETSRRSKRKRQAAASQASQASDFLKVLSQATQSMSQAHPSSQLSAASDTSSMPDSELDDESQSDTIPIDVTEKPPEITGFRDDLKRSWDEMKEGEDKTVVRVEAGHIKRLMDMW